MVTKYIKKILKQQEISHTFMKYQYNHLICKSNYTLLVIASHYHTCAPCKINKLHLC